MANFELQFTWDKRKNEANYRKHGITFEEAVFVFDDPFHLTIQDREVEGESRCQTIGIIPILRLVLVAHTETENEGEEITRIISARKATRSERRIYGSQIKNRHI